MAIIGTLPNNIQNGQLADSVPLMADLNFIVNQVNANAAPTGVLTAPSGTRMLFNQPAVPTGWTQETGAAFSDSGLRVVTGTGGATAGSTAWSSWNGGGTFNNNAFTLTTTHLPSHSHAVTDPGHTHITTNGYMSTALVGGSIGSGVTAFGTDNSINGAFTGVTVGFTGLGNAFTSTYTTPSVKYTDMIIGVKT